MNENFLEKKLKEREDANAVRTLRLNNNAIDFCSNDYLGIVKNKLIENVLTPGLSHGSTGSRLLSGNYTLIETTERSMADFHECEEALIFNSGYDANLGLLSSVPQKEDIIFYDKLSHASIRDGIRLSFATSYSFLHNDITDLEKKLSAVAKPGQNIFVVTESIFSMDGDMAPLQEISQLCEQYNAALIVDEAHATGVAGEKGEGLIQHLRLSQKCFVRLHTFGKACGCHGAVILGSAQLKKYLINFARPFIYSTALPPSGIGAIAASFKLFPFMDKEREHLRVLVSTIKKASMKYAVVNSITPIQAVIVPGNDEVKKMAAKLQENNIDVRPILYPTVPKGGERLRVVLHSFNTIDEVNKLTNILC